MEDALAKRVQETADHLLSNAVGDCGNAQRACFPCVSFGDVDASERQGLVGPVFQTSFERDQVLDELRLIQSDGDAIDARGSAVAFDAPEGVPKGKQVDTTCQGMCFDLGQSVPFQQSPWNEGPVDFPSREFVENVLNSALEPGEAGRSRCGTVLRAG